MPPEPNEAVTVADGQGLRLGERIIRLVGGTVQFWRHDPAHWPHILEAVRSLGYGIVDTSISWSVHEVSEGLYDWRGPRDFGRFCAIAADLGLFLTVRPGPVTNAEVPDFGLPKRVTWKPGCQARSPAGTPVFVKTRTDYFPAPSYASAEYMAHVEAWYDEVAPILTRLLWPNGPIVLVQLDNELGYFFRTEPFAMDYSDAFLSEWRSFPGSADDAPVDDSAPPEVVESWMRFREVHIHRRLAELGRALRDRGVVGVPFYHNDYPALTTPIDHGAEEASGAVDFVGCDCYASREQAWLAKTTARRLSSTRLPFMPELGAGWIIDPTELALRSRPLDDELTTLAALLCGIRAFTFYMLVEREQWYGSPITRTGEIREPEAKLHTRLHRLIDDLDWWNLARVAPVLVVRDKDTERRFMSRQVACATAGVLSRRHFPGGLRLAPADADHPSPIDFMNAWRTALERAGLDFDEASTDAIPDVSRYELVVVGPGNQAPSALEHPRILCALPSEDIELPRAAFTHGGTDRVSLHYFVAQGREVLGALNEHDNAATLDIGCSGSVRLVGRWRDELIEGTDHLKVELPAYSAQIWEVHRT